VSTVQDILEEEEMELDWDFRLSLINDIVKDNIYHIKDNHSLSRHVDGKYSFQAWKRLFFLTLL
jgi:hypothetical protein